MTWKKNMRRVASKIAPTKMNTGGGESWRNWLDNKKKERDGEGIEPSVTSGNPNQWGTNMSGSVRDKHRCIMCSRALNHSHPATVTDPQTGFKYCRPCAKKKGLV